MGSSNNSSGSSSNWRGYTGSDSIGYVRDVVYNHYTNYSDYTEEKDKLDKNDYNYEQNLKRLEEKYKSKHSIYIPVVYYNYKAIGSHRFIEIKLECRACSFTKYVRMDKTDDARKNIVCYNGPFNTSGWWWWEYKPRNTNFEDCIRYFNNAPSGYNLATNNCADFARYIWNRLD